jgi:hypothetical protein
MARSALIVPAGPFASQYSETKTIFERHAFSRRLGASLGATRAYNFHARRTNIRTGKFESPNAPMTCSAGFLLSPRLSLLPRPGPSTRVESRCRLTATVTATAAANGKRQRPTTAHNSRTIRANLAYARPEKTSQELECQAASLFWRWDQAVDSS